jgi:signal transduction histidine kinase
MNLRGEGRSPVLVVALGAATFLGALAHHATELLALGGVLGPLAALVLDGVPALGLVYAGCALANSDLGPDDRRAVVGWTFGGAGVFGGAMGATVLVRLFEGRPMTEPLFPLLVAIEFGALAGTVAGYYSARARADARRARAVSDALGFVNGLIRHDLRNDLNVIRGYADIAGETADSGDSAAVIAAKAEEALDRIETTRAVTGTLLGEPEIEPVDLVPLSEEVAAGVAEVFDARVRTETPERAAVAANAGVRSVVDNLIENAAEHNDATHPEIGVEIGIQGETVELTVRDNGPGIPETERERLLNPDGEGATGLALVRTLVEEYGGELRIAENEPRGAAVTVALPRAEG